MINEEIIVSIHCLTFNQVNYIRQTLESFLMQHTDFKYEVVIHDDASTDGTTDVILEYQSKYPDIIKPIIQKENRYSRIGFVGIYELMTPYLRGKYVAMCEGDDYWIDPLKLQKQVDFMEAHPDYTLCGSNGLVLWEEGVKPPHYFKKLYPAGEVLPEELIGHWCFPTASLLFKKDIFCISPDWTKKIYSLDQTKTIIAMSKGKVHRMTDITCVYRKVLGGVTASNVADEHFVYVLKQHQIMYSEFDKWTGMRYHDLVQEDINKRSKEIRYYDLKNKYKLLVFILKPMYSANRLFQKIRKLKKKIIKR